MTIKEAPPTALQLPHDRLGFLGLTAIHSFFAQKYQNHELCVRHSAKLFNHLLTGAYSGKIILVVRCRDCQRDPRTPSCTSSAVSHYESANRTQMEVGIASLKRVNLTDFGKKIAGVSPETAENLKLLQLHF